MLKDILSCPWVPAPMLWRSILRELDWLAGCQRPCSAESLDRSGLRTFIRSLISAHTCRCSQHSTAFRLHPSGMYFKVDMLHTPGKSLKKCFDVGKKLNILDGIQMPA